jgi:hypothetical protein
MQLDQSVPINKTLSHAFLLSTPPLEPKTFSMKTYTDAPRN